MNVQEQLISLADGLSADTLAEGKAWYGWAHGWCKDLAESSDLTVGQVAGIVSALSPSVKWDLNLRQANSFIAYDGHATVSTYNAQKEKARLILQGAQQGFMGPKKIEEILKGPKTISFFNNMLRPRTAGRVTIDRHMLSMLDYKQGLTLRRYTELEENFRQVSRIFGVLPHQLQASLWLAQRRLA